MLPITCVPRILSCSFLIYTCYLCVRSSADVVFRSFAVLRKPGAAALQVWKSWTQQRFGAEVRLLTELLSSKQYAKRPCAKSEKISLAGFQPATS